MKRVKHQEVLWCEFRNQFYKRTELISGFVIWENPLNTERLKR